MSAALVAALLLLAADAAAPPAKGAPAAQVAPAAKGAKGAKAARKPPPADGLHRTEPRGWASTGFHQLRWGMGPGDVKDALADEGDLLRSAEPFALGEGYEPAGEGGARIAAPGFTVAGHPSILGFRFFRDRLVAVALLPADDVGDPAAWAATLKALLTERYGPPSTSADDQTTWLRDGAKVTLPFLPGWTSSVGWFSPPIAEARPAAAAAPPSLATPEQQARAEAERKARAEAEQKARAEAEARARAAFKAEAAKL